MLSQMLSSELENNKKRLKMLIENKAYLGRDPKKGEEPFELASRWHKLLFI